MREHRDGLTGGILPIIRKVRRRWRLRILMGGTSLVAATALLAFGLSAWGLEALRFSPAAVTAFRITSWLVVGALTAWYVIRPLVRKVSDQQVALYLEEHEPTLEAAILGAMEVQPQAAPHGVGLSGEFLQRLVQQAVDRAEAVEFGRRIEQQRLCRSTGVLSAVALAALAFLLLAPPSLRHGVSALLLPTTDADEVSPYSIAVEPGDVTIARGSDQFVIARLEGFTSEDVSLFTRADGSENYRRISMLTTEDGLGFEVLLLNLQEETSYFVESDGIRSETYRIGVEDLPYVNRMDHEYVFPAYTGLEPRVVEDGGDIAALEGTMVKLTVEPTIRTRAGRLVIDDTEAIELVVTPEGALLGELEVRRRGVYRIEMATADGTLVTASPTFIIDVLTDQPPSIRFERPGRDTPASPVEEVYLEARADDDFGISEVQLAYSVNGEPEQTLTMYRSPGGEPLREVSAGRTLFLEEWELEAGDVISYYAAARDNNAAARDNNAAARDNNAAARDNNAAARDNNAAARDNNAAARDNNAAARDNNAAARDNNAAARDNNAAARDNNAAARDNNAAARDNNAAARDNNAAARDNNAAGGSREVKSDIYFINVRPFGRDYRQAEASGPPPGAGAGGAAGPETALSELQRQVIAATFNLGRDVDLTDETTFRENVTSVALAQGRVRAQVETLVERMLNRGITNADERFREIAEMLPESIEDMKAAEELLQGEDFTEALAPEQRALRVLLKAEETYERFVEQSRQQGGGGGGGGRGPNADDLADLFELELDKLRNQYETVQRGERQGADEQVDELMEKLQELARRQQQEEERQRQRAAQQGGGAGGASDAQRSLAEETEQAARQLERLARESGDQRLEETARRLQEAADAMRRSAASSANGRLAETAAALDRLEEARRRLERTQEDRTREATELALERTRRLAESQRAVQQGVGDLSPDQARRSDQIRQLLERKQEMIREAEGLERELDELAADLRRDSPDAASRVGDAADFIEESKLKEKIAFSRGVVSQRDQEYAAQFEEQIATDIAELQRRVEQAGEATDGIQEERAMERNLERAQDLVRGMGSMDRRLRQRGQGDGQREQGAEGQQSQQGQQGQGQEGQGQGGQGDGRLDPGGQQGTQGGPGGTNLDDPSLRGGATSGVPRPFTEDEMRQYRREYLERMRDAETLRDGLREEGRDSQDLEEAIEALRRLQDENVYRDLPQIALLQEELRESLRRVEFTLRREVEGEREDRVFLSGSDEVPTGFRKLVEEYYRSLARDPSGDG